MSPKFKKKVIGLLIAVVLIFIADNVKFFLSGEESLGYLEILKDRTFPFGTLAFFMVILAFFKHQKDT